MISLNVAIALAVPLGILGNFDKIFRQTIMLTTVDFPTANVLEALR